ncbi:regulatory protein AfsR [Microtetraspora sp. NBRC 13810]|uniref:AfsR/SARP family transcriptional regulator n=1 Tax=Microtetraspora sp. NBRC 13810 TaxID=3030990 RepID=UPI0024A210A2|nr:BTAD domain-containing putative transcriptional regulator [Microtetraspora sp. NBRC 13810]GLW09637.1 regulatory protein AfsR [Microtetraspora sp. NBRC 13810]
MIDGIAGRTEGEVEFRLLGPVGVWAGGDLLGPAVPQQRAVLALLLLNVRRQVSVDGFVHAIWGESPPAWARNALSGYVSRLRRVLAGVPQVELVTARPGYRLDLDPMRVDIYRFRDLVSRARSQDAATAGDLFRQALSLWRGPALADVTGHWLATEAAVLEEERVAALEERIAIDVRAGRHRETLSELSTLVNAHPLRERPMALLMRALWQDGRQGAALQVFRDARSRLVAELGIEPGEELQGLHQRILEGEPADTATLPTAAEPSPIPAELPADVASFAGRAAETRLLTTALSGGGPPDGVMRICQISGIGGVGKSTLAVHVARTVVDQFPDGQLYVNLHGATPDVKPTRPEDALGRFLRSLGVAAAAVPGQVEEAAVRFRSLTEGRRMLIVLDNAYDAAQVRPLLPGSPTCAVLITSRRMLTSFDDAVHLSLDVLPVTDGLALLSRAAGTARIAAEPAAAAELVRLCGGLPLALRLVSARLIARPAMAVSMLATRLATARRRLDELHADDRAVRASFQGGYQDLHGDVTGTAAARTFRLLGLLDGPDISVPVAAALSGTSDERTRLLLEHLVDAQLVDNHAPDRYRLHDLLRLFARERAEEEETPHAREHAVTRALHCYLATTRTALALLNQTSTWRTGIGPQRLTHPGIPLREVEDLHAWLDSEEENLLAAVGLAAGTPAAELAVALAASLAMLLYERGHWPDQLRLAELALRAAEQTGDLGLQARMLSDLGWAHALMGQNADAVTQLRRSLAAYQRLGNRRHEAAVLDNLGIVHRALGRLDDAAELHRRALHINREIGDQWGQASSLSHLGLVYQHDGRFDEAIDLHHQAMEIVEEVGSQIDRVSVLVHLAEAHRLAAQPLRAVERYRQAQKIHRDVGRPDGYRQAELYWGLGLALHDAGDAAEARQAWHRSSTILHRLGLISVEETQAIHTSPAPPATPQPIRRQL